MTLRSLSASESWRGVALLGGSEEDSGPEEEETTSDEGFISCRLRQKAATCSVLYRERKTVMKSETSDSPALLLPHTHTLSQHLQLDPAAQMPVRMKNAIKIISTHLLYFQPLLSSITPSFWLSLSIPPSLLFWNVLISSERQPKHKHLSMDAVAMGTAGMAHGLSFSQ